MIAPCWRRWPTRRSTIPSWSTNRNTTASARSSRSRPGDRSACGRGWATKRRGSFPRSRPRWRSGRARRKAPLVLDGEIVALDAKGQPAGFQQLQGRIHLSEGDDGAGARTALIAFDILKDGAVDYRDRPLTRAARRTREDLPEDRIADAADQRSGARRRPRPVGAGDGTGLGRTDRQARGVALQVGQALARLAQIEAGARTGIRHRRLDRAAADARVLRRAAARRLRAAPTWSMPGIPAPASTKRSWRA